MLKKVRESFEIFAPRFAVNELSSFMVILRDLSFADLLKSSKNLSFEEN
jgi:hypothetical protein